MLPMKVKMLLLWSILLVSFTTASVIHNPSTAIQESSALVCENSLLTLDCEKKKGVIRISRANYGRFSLGTCNNLGATNEWNVRCIHPESKRIVAERCDGHPKCNITASNEVFGDPCVNTFKYLQVYYRCEPKKVTPAPPTTTKSTTTTTAGTTTTRKATTTTPLRRVCDAMYIEGKNWPYTNVGDVASMKCPPPKVGTMTWRCTGAGWHGERPDDSKCQLPVTEPPSGTTTTPKISFCEETESQGVIWPQVRVGVEVERPCPEGKLGKMTWKCSGRGWKGRQPDTSNCVSPWLNSIDERVNSSASSIEDIADQLKQQTDTRNLGAGDLEKMNNIITKMGQGFKISGMPNKEEKRQRLEKFTKNIAETGSNILSEKQSNSWEELPDDKKTKVAASFLVSMETTGFNIAENLQEEESIVSSTENLFMEVSAVKVAEDKPALTYPSSRDQKWTDDQITIPMENIEALSDDGGITKVVVFVYQNMEDLMTTQDNSTVINSHIMSASLSPQTVKLKKPVTFTLKLTKALHGSLTPVCAYWEFRDSEWSTSGCWRVNFNLTHTTCRCSHLTNFAVLMDVTGTQLSVEHEFALMTITFIGCSISIICLLLSFITFFYFRNLQCDRNTIHKNLVLSLMLAEIIFMIGISLTQNKIVCGVVAGLLHFLFLAAFAWMCLEGFQLYVMLIEVFEGERSRRKWYYLFGYGIPLVTVAVTAGVKPSGYGTDRHCWLDTGASVIWSFVGPALAVILFNIVMLSIAVYMMHKHANTLALAKGRSKFSSGILRDPSSGTSQSTTMSDEKASTARQIPSWVKGAAILVVLLGLTWAFGVLFISEESVTMAYVFTVLNSFQGLFIFVFHCLMNEKVKKEYKKFAYKSTWLPECMRAYCLGYSSASGSHTPNHSSSSGGHLLKLWSGRRRRKSSSTTLEKSAKGKKRISEPRSDSSVFTSHDMNSPIVKQPASNGRQPNMDSNGYLRPYPEYEAILGDLSEVNCSVIDSEYVSEYCQNRLQVSKETNAYSSESDNEDDRDQPEKNRLSILSKDSAEKNDSDFNLSHQNISETEFLLEKSVSEKNLLNKAQDEKSRINCDSLGKKIYPGSFSEIPGYLSDGEELNHSMPLISSLPDYPGAPLPPAGSHPSLTYLHIEEETFSGDKNNNSSDC
ncbi:adhesion G protein-coupled receptor L2-like [Saccostrea cucullata]|uniref:adhesion G protein-coupled receptor L2-like n=1 Tax=Saccostrea cuccullata TaxID=36930 RepID=UPI002ED6492B